MWLLKPLSVLGLSQGLRRSYGLGLGFQVGALGFRLGTFQRKDAGCPDCDSLLGLIKIQPPHLMLHPTEDSLTLPLNP